MSTKESQQRIIAANGAFIYFYNIDKYCGHGKVSPQTTKKFFTDQGYGLSTENGYFESYRFDIANFNPYMSIINLATGEVEIESTYTGKCLSEMAVDIADIAEHINENY